MIITIADRYGNPKTEVSSNDSSTWSKEIQSDDVLTLSFTHYDCVLLDVDDYVDFDGARYWLCEKYRPKQKSTHEWEYNLKLYGIESLLKNILVIKRVDNEENPVFSLTAPPSEHVAMIVNCLNDGMGNITDWKVGQVEGTENIVIDYFGKYCDEALREIAEKVGAEYWVEGQTVNVCRCEHGDPIILGYDKGLTWIEPDRADNVKFYTRLYPVGSSRNIDPEKYGYSRLQLPNGEKYVEINADKYGRKDHYEEAAFADIYPRRIGKISSVRSEVKTGEDGNPFTIYYFRDDGLPFDPNKYEISGLVKRVSFQEGSELAGLGAEESGTYYFEVNFNSDTQEFEIITTWPYDDGRQLPGGSLIPKVGDKYILWHLRMPDEYYRLAEEEFRTAVDKYNKEHGLDITVFKASTDHVWIEDNNADLFVGRRVRLESEEYFPETGYRDSRITKITRKINLPSSMDLEIGDALSRSSKQKFTDDIADVRSYAQSIGASISLPDIIRTGDKTKATDNNLLSALRSYKEFLSKTKDDTAEGFIKFLKGLFIGEYVAGASGGFFGFDENGDSFAEMDRLYVRIKAFFEQLTIIKAGVIAGKQYITPGGGVICTKVEETETAYRCWFLSEQDGEQTQTMMEAGDQAISEMFNAKAGTANKVSNHRYWRLVTAVDNDALTDDNGNHYGYIDLSKTDCENDSDIPQAQDEICQLGSRNDTDRQSAMVFSTVDADAPSVKLYNGINSYSLADKAVITFGKDAATGKIFFRLGTSTDSHYFEYTQDGGLVVAGRISSKSTIDNTPIDKYIESKAGEAQALFAEYSVTGADGTWHSEYADGDMFMRQSTDGGATWTAAMPFIGHDGTPGENGKDGAYPKYQWAKSYLSTPAPTSGWQDTPPTASAGQYIWMRMGMVTPPATEPETWEKAVRLTGDKGTDGTSPYLLDLDNEVIPMACDADGNVLGGYPAVKATMYKGGSKATSVTYTIAEASGITASVNSSGTVTLGALTADKAYAIVQAKSGTVTLQSRIDIYKVKPGADGSSVGVDESKSSISYQASERATIVPTGNWQSSIPSVPPNHYLWTRVITAYTDGSSTTAYSVSRQGSDGKNGEDGTSVVVASTEVRYVWGNYPSQPADSLFTHSSIGTLTKGQWLWTRTTVKYSDNKSTKSYTAAYIGSDGSDGLPGAPGENGLTTYVHFAYASGITGSLPHPTSVTGFSTTSFAGAKYIGVCTDYDAADPTENVGSTYEWSEYKGADGDDAVIYDIIPSADNITRGGDGKLSVSALTCAVYKTVGASRSTSNDYTLTYQRIPDMSDPQTLSRTEGVSSQVAILDDTEAVIFELKNSNVTLDRERVPVLTDASGLVIGGENLLRNTDYIDGKEYWQWNGATDDISIKSDASSVYNNRRSMYVDHPYATETWRSVYQKCQGMPNTTYTISGYLKVVEGSLSGASNTIIANTASGEIVIYPITDTGGQWKYFEASFTTGDIAEGSALDIFFRLQSAGRFYLNSLKLEKGNKATGWSASPLDSSYLREALRQSTASMEGGLICGTTIMLGTADDDGALNVTAGMNGAVKNPTDLAYWSGGKPIDKAVEPDNADAATCAIRHNGTFYGADNKVRILKDRLEMGRDGQHTDIALIPGAKAMRIYDSDSGEMTQELSGVRYSNPVNAFYAGAQTGKITFNPDPPTPLKLVGTGSNTVIDGPANPVSVTGTINSTSNILNLVMGGGKITVTARALSATGSFAEGYADFILQQLDTANNVTSEVVIASVTVRAESMAPGGTLPKTQELSLSGMRITSSSPGRFRLAIDYWGVMLNGIVEVSWSGLSADYGTPVYRSSYFANGYLLGDAINDYVAVYHDGTGMVKEARMGDYGIRLTKAGLRVLAHGNLWVPVPLPFYQGRINVTSGGTLSIGNDNGYASPRPTVSKISASELDVVFPDEWKKLKNGQFMSYIYTEVETYNASVRATVLWTNSDCVRIGYSGNIVLTELKIYMYSSPR